MRGISLRGLAPMLERLPRLYSNRPSHKRSACSPSPTSPTMPPDGAVARLRHLGGRHWRPMPISGWAACRWQQSRLTTCWRCCIPFGRLRRPPPCRSVAASNPYSTTLRRAARCDGRKHSRTPQHVRHIGGRQGGMMLDGEPERICGPTASMDRSRTCSISKTG
jgi:hypothetical protein